MRPCVHGMALTVAYNACMLQTPPLPPSPRQVDPTDEEICLMGATRLADFLDFVSKRAVGGHDMDRGDLAALWRDAAEVYESLQTSEHGAADQPGVKPLTPALQAHVDQLVKLPNFQSTFASVPVAFGMVELNKLVAYQQHITQSTLRHMTDSLRMPLADADLAALCLPLTPANVGFRVAQAEGKRFVFVADNHDARFLGAQVLSPPAVPGLVTDGHPQAVLALSVGLTTNVLNVVRYGGRMVLNNGYHRALALMQLGVTHAPCLIQVCAHWEDVGLAGAGEMYSNGPAYFSTARPPMLRDFANPALTRTFVTKRFKKEIRISFEVETGPLFL